MSMWNKIVLGTKFLFIGFESASDYALKLLNAFLCRSDIANNIQKAHSYIETILGYMVKYQKYCPMVWVADYEKLLAVIQTFRDAIADNEITREEIEKAISDVKAAIAEWMRD